MGLAQVIPFWACYLFFNRFFVIWAFSSFIFHHVSAKIMLQLTLWFLEHIRLCQSSRSWNVDEMNAFLCHMHFALDGCLPRILRDPTWHFSPQGIPVSDQTPKGNRQCIHIRVIPGGFNKVTNRRYYSQKNGQGIDLSASLGPKGWEKRGITRIQTQKGRIVHERPSWEKSGPLDQMNTLGAHSFLPLISCWSSPLAIPNQKPERHGSLVESQTDQPGGRE